MSKASGWIPALEGLRGIASLVVVMRHSVGAVGIGIPARRDIVEGPLAPLFNGDGAIAIFFVLSGTVLAGSIDRSRVRLPLLHFWIKRIARIHLPYVVAVLVAWLASFLYVVPALGEGFSNWLRRLANVHVGLNELAAALSFPGTASMQLPVGWTLEIEMAFSLAFPLLWATAGRLHWAPLCLASLALPFIDGAPFFFGFSINFCLGIGIYRERERLSRWLGEMRGPRAALCALAGITVITLPEWSGWGAGLGWGQRAAPFDSFRLLARALGAGLLVSFAAHVPAIARPLSLRPCLFLGRVSYGLYLLHIPALILATNLIPTPTPARAGLSAALLLAATLAIALPLCAAFFRLIEQPSIGLGRRLASHLERTSEEGVRSQP